jgi:hypothetical protein
MWNPLYNGLNGKEDLRPYEKKLRVRRVIQFYSIEDTRYMV